MYPIRRSFCLQGTQDIQNCFTYVVNNNSNPRRKTKVFIHGFLDGFCRPVCMKVGRILLFINWRFFHIIDDSREVGGRSIVAP